LEILYRIAPFGKLAGAGATGRHDCESNSRFLDYNSERFGADIKGDPF
jgi:hypothetical protein